jgi:hypothetical protein
LGKDEDPELLHGHGGKELQVRSDATKSRPMGP